MRTIDITVLQDKKHFHADRLAPGVFYAIACLCSISATIGPEWIRLLLLFLGIAYLYAHISKLTPRFPSKHVAIGFVAAIICAYRAIQSPQAIIQNAPLNQKTLYTIAGSVSDTQIKPSDRFGYVIRLDRVIIKTEKSNEQLSIKGYIDIHVPKIIWLLPGDKIVVTNAKLKTLSGGPLEAWAVRHSIAATAFVENNQVAKKGKIASPARSIAKYKISLLKKIKPHLNDDAYRLFKTIMLGMTTNSNATDKLRCRFQNWGLAHMLARSGLHMALIAVTVSLALSPLGIASTITLLLNMILLLGLCLLSWNGLSFMRAIYMWSLAQSCIYLKRRPNIMHNLGLVATGCLLWQPFFVFSLDFQLTFFVTAALILINSQLRKEPIKKISPSRRARV